MDILTVLVTAVLGSGGIVGVAFYFLRRWMENRLHAAESKADARRKQHIQLSVIEREMWQAVGRVLFWLVRAAHDSGHANGELTKAQNKYDAADAKRKDLERQIVATFENDGRG